MSGRCEDERTCRNRKRPKEHSDRETEQRGGSEGKRNRRERWEGRKRGHLENRGAVKSSEKESNTSILSMTSIKHSSPHQ